jgi:hypothetical protein
MKHSGLHRPQLSRRSSPLELRINAVCLPPNHLNCKVTVNCNLIHSQRKSVSPRHDCDFEGGRRFAFFIFVDRHHHQREAQRHHSIKTHQPTKEQNKHRPKQPGASSYFIFSSVAVLLFHFLCFRWFKLYLYLLSLSRGAVFGSPQCPCSLLLADNNNNKQRQGCEPRTQLSCTFAHQRYGNLGTRPSGPPATAPAAASAATLPLHLLPLSHARAQPPVAAAATTPAPRG